MFHNRGLVVYLLVYWCQLSVSVSVLIPAAGLSAGPLNMNEEIRKNLEAVCGNILNAFDRINSAGNSTTPTTSSSSPSALASASLQSSQLHGLRDSSLNSSNPSVEPRLQNSQPAYSVCRDVRSHPLQTTPYVYSGPQSSRSMVPARHMHEVRLLSRIAI